MSKATDVPAARPSSTVVLARDGRGGPELFMVKRYAASSFGGAFVFPGGVVENTDRDVEDCCGGITAQKADHLLKVDGAGLAYFAAAIRELFEETGVLLAAHTTNAAELDAIRRRLNEASLDWRRFVESNGVRLSCDELHYFSHWITPDVMPKRFSTRFFIARLPDGAVAQHDRRELADGLWTTVRDALNAAGRGDLLLHYPTIRTLEQLAGHESVDAMFRWADRVSEDGVTAIKPVFPRRAGGGLPETPGGSAT